MLFLDELTTGLDPESRQRTWGLVRDLLAGRTTITLTTYYLRLVGMRKLGASNRHDAVQIARRNGWI